jgi:hypothetical protein
MDQWPEMRARTSKNCLLGLRPGEEEGSNWGGRDFESRSRLPTGTKGQTLVPVGVTNMD